MSGDEKPATIVVKITRRGKGADPGASSDAIRSISKVVGEEARRVARFADDETWQVEAIFPDGSVDIVKNNGDKRKSQVFTIGGSSGLAAGMLVKVGHYEGNPDRPFIRTDEDGGAIGADFSRNLVFRPLYDGIWVQGQGFPDLRCENRSGSIYNPGTLTTVATVETTVDEPPLGVVGYYRGIGNSLPTLAWLTGHTAASDGTIHSLHIDAFDQDTLALVWSLDFGAHDRLNLTLDEICQGHFFVDETLRCLIVLGYGGQEWKYATAIDGNGGGVLGRINTGYYLENSSVGRGKVVKGWTTYRGYDARRQQDSLIRAWSCNADTFIWRAAWTYSLPSFYGSGFEVASSGRGRFGTEGRWPINLNTSEIMIWSSGWYVPTDNATDAALTGGSREAAHRYEACSILGLRLDDGAVNSSWLRIRAASDVLRYDTASVNLWDAYWTQFHSGDDFGVGIGTIRPPENTSGITISVFQYGGFAADRSLTVGNIPVDYLLGPISPDTRSSFPGVYNYSVFNGTQVQAPDYSHFAKGHPLLLPYEGNNAALDSTATADEIITWPSTNQSAVGIHPNFSATDPVGGCMVVDSNDFTWVAWMEPDVYVLGSSNVICNSPPVISTDTTPTFPTGIDRAHWTKYMAGSVQQCSRTMLLKRAADGSGAPVDVSHLYDYYLPTYPPNVPSGYTGADILSTYQRATRDNVYAIAPLPTVGLVGVLRDARDTLYAGALGTEQLPYLVIELRDYSTLSLASTLTMPENTSTVTITVGGSPVVVRKWSFYESPPVIRLQLINGNPVVYVFLNVKRGDTGLTYARCWRIYWAGGTGVAPTVAILDTAQSADNIPVSPQEAGSLCQVGNLVAWGGQISTSGTMPLKAVRL